MNEIFEKRDFSLGRTETPVVSPKDLQLTSFYAASPVDDFMHQVHKPAHSDSNSIRLTSDIYMLFNQQRLDKMTLQALTAHIAEMRISEPSLNFLKSKLTDDQLASIVKSRYIQTPSELINYSKYLNSLADSEIQALVAAQKPIVDESPIEAPVEQQPANT